MTGKPKEHLDKGGEKIRFLFWLAITVAIWLTVIVVAIVFVVPRLCAPIK